jgi:hypothetical protein
MKKMWKTKNIFFVSILSFFMDVFCRFFADTPPHPPISFILISLSERKLKKKICSRLSFREAKYGYIWLFGICSGKNNQNIQD